MVLRIGVLYGRALARRARLPVSGGLGIAPALHVFHPVVVPRVEVEGADLGDVRAQVAVDARALEADELAEVDARPRVLRQFDRAVGADGVLRELDQLHELLAVAGSLLLIRLVVGW